MRAAVLGSPIAHSLSPAMHRAAYATLGLAWTYEAHDVAEGELARFVEGLGPRWRGFSVTAPLKREAAQFASSRDEIVQTLGVANTLVCNDGAWSAHNTDVPGAASALRSHGVHRLDSVRVLGAGATAVSMLLVAARLGATTAELVVRDRARAVDTLATARRLGLDADAVALSDPVGEGVDLLVNTAPASATAGREHEFVSSAAAVFDVIYDPWPSALVRAAHVAGLPAATGLDLLAHQAAAQVALMTGESVAPDVLLDAALGTLHS